MIEGMFDQANYQLAQTMLDFAAKKHEALASNLANVETQGYRRVDVQTDFQQKLKSAMEMGQMDRVREMKPELETDPNTLTLRADGNNVELDHELMEISKNALNYEFLTQYINGTYSKLNKAISGNVRG